MKNVNFANLNGGELVRRFTREFSRVLEDIGNADKSRTATRRITIEIDITPAESGEDATVVISSKLKLPAIHSKQGIIDLDETPDGIAASVRDDGQGELFEDGREYEEDPK